MPRSSGTVYARDLVSFRGWVSKSCAHGGMHLPGDSIRLTGLTCAHSLRSVWGAYVRDWYVRDYEVSVLNKGGEALCV